jgi:hypothetical protein
VNVTGFDDPADVVTTTWTEPDPGNNGTVTVQVLWTGHLVGATWPLKVATICPLELRKLAPAI